MLVELKQIKHKPHDLLFSFCLAFRLVFFETWLFSKDPISGLEILIQFSACLGNGVCFWDTNTIKKDFQGGMRGYLPKIENLHNFLYLMSFHNFPGTQKENLAEFLAESAVLFFLAQQKGMGNEGVKASAEHVKKNKKH